ncbi:MAG: cytochrome c [Gemmatimonadetes bacterium]|nr:cytochrome c [Gemmatimonadota bacterium]
MMLTFSSRSVRTALVVAGTALLVPSAKAAAQGADSLTTLSKIYTAVQAAKGKDAFDTTCLSCHKPVELAGYKFWSGLVGRPLGEFFGYIRSNMPQDNPGSITDEDYAGITAYILQLNTMPAGERPLPGDSVSLAKIRVVAPDTTRKGFGK